MNLFDSEGVNNFQLLAFLAIIPLIMERKIDQERSCVNFFSFYP